PDLAGVSKLSSFLRRQQERAEPAALVALRPADDHEFLALDALDLEPIARADAFVGRVRLLGDDPLAPLLADFAEKFVASANDVIAVEDGRRHAFQQRGQPLLAVDIRELANVLTTIDQQVEPKEDQIRTSLVFQSRLKQLEARSALVVERDRFSIDQATGRKLRRGFHQGAKLVAPILAVAGPSGRRSFAD